MTAQQLPGSTQHQAKETAGQVADQARQTADTVMHQARETARTTVDTQKDKTASTLGSVAQALRQTGKTLNDQDQASFGRMAENAASSLERFSQDLSSKSVGELVDGVHAFARRDPQMFLGGALVVGLLAARFFKSSARKPEPQQPYSGRNWQEQQNRGYYERGTTDFPTGEGFRQGFSSPSKGTGYDPLTNRQPGQASTYTTPASTDPWRETGRTEPHTTRREEGNV